MFGYLPGPKLCCSRAAQTYRAHFCGLATQLHHDFGSWARFLVNRDSSALLLLGTSLQLEKPDFVTKTCCLPWGTPRELLPSQSLTAYTSAITLLGLTTKLDDDQHDERGMRRSIAQIASHLTQRAEASALGLLHGIGFPLLKIRQALNSQTGLEKAGADLAACAEPTRMAFGEIYAHLAGLSGAPNTQADLRTIGEELGFLVYAQDAWDDLPNDKTHQRFNPLANRLDALNYLLHTSKASFEKLKTAFQALPFQRHEALLSQSLLTGIETRLADLQSSSEDSQKPKKRKEDGSSRNSCLDCCQCCDCCTHAPSTCRVGSCADATDCKHCCECDCNCCDGCSH